MSSGFDFLAILKDLAVGYIPFLFALCFHEMSHAFVAKMRGDRTGEMAGRMSMNPFVHADPMGTFLLPILATAYHFPFFGWAKPVPVNSRNLANPRVDLFWIALAGPLSNILLAFVGSFVMVFLILQASAASGEPGGSSEAILAMLKSFVLINLVLAFFNLIPVHPLDGGKVIERFLPYNINQKLNEHQGTINIVLMIALFAGGFRFIMIPVEFFYMQFLTLAHMVLA